MGGRVLCYPLMVALPAGCQDTALAVSPGVLDTSRSQVVAARADNGEIARLTT